MRKNCTFLCHLFVNIYIRISCHHPFFVVTHLMLMFSCVWNFGLLLEWLRKINVDCMWSPSSTVKRFEHSYFTFLLHWLPCGCLLRLPFRHTCCKHCQHSYMILDSHVPLSLPLCLAPGVFWVRIELFLYIVIANNIKFTYISVYSITSSTNNLLYHIR